MVNNRLLASKEASQSKQLARPSRTFLNSYWALGLISIALLTACGGGGGSGGAGDDKNPVNITFAPSAQLAKTCANPNLSAGEKQGTVENEKTWIRSFIDERYLWYSDVPNVDASKYATAQAYFDVLKTSKKNSADKDLDRFHFSYPTGLWNQYSNGVSLDYGIQWGALSKDPPRNYVVLNVEPNSPAGQLGVRRGDKLLSVDGTNIDDDVALNKALDPDDSTHDFVFQRGQTNNAPISLRAGQYDLTPVRATQLIPGTTVGYIYLDSFLQFNTQNILASAISGLKSQNARDLVIDLRYNGGGLISVSSQLAYMIAGPSASNRKTFYKLVYNDKRIKENYPYPFLPYILKPEYDYDYNKQLPSLDLRSVTFLVDHGTASASEALINGLRGIGIKVNLIGSTTYGKPYGFNPQANCGQTYFAVEFKGENNLGFSDYDAGFTPNCYVKDDPSYALGDPSEPRLAAALQYMATGKCSANPVTAMKASIPAINTSPVFEPNPMRLLSIHTKIKP